MVFGSKEFPPASTTISDHKRGRLNLQVSPTPPHPDSLGELYESGESISKNYPEAVRWYKLAAEAGVDDAQNALGLMYGQGRGINRDAKEALRWLMKAAAQGNVKAHVNLSTSYFHGYVTPKDGVVAQRPGRTH